MVAHEFVVGVVAGRQGVPDGEPKFDVGCDVEQRCGQGSQRRGDDEHARAAVVDDVGRLVGCQVSVDERQKQTGTLKSPGDLVGPVIIDGEHGHLVPDAQPEGEQGLRQLARPGLELTEGHRPARGCDDGGTVGMRGGVGRGRVVRHGGFGSFSAGHAHTSSRNRLPGARRPPCSSPPRRPLPAACRHRHPDHAPDRHDPEIAPRPR